MKAKDRLILALDVPTPDDARKLIHVLGSSVGVYKIGLELLFAAGGVPLMDKLLNSGHKVFIDAKLLDIGNTIERAVTNIARIGATFLTIHCTDRKTLDAAIKGRGNSALKLLAVTVLTNLQQSDLLEQGIQMSGAELVSHRAKLALDAGFDGVVASGFEAAQIREDCGPDFQIVTPGIRPSWADVGDQARVVTPAKAISVGANYIVVGRPITESVDPLKATQDIIAEIEKG